MDDAAAGTPISVVTAMMSLETRKAVPLPQALRDAIESYRRRTTDGSN
jgi:acyl-CoA thioesterase FadM